MQNRRKLSLRALYASHEKTLIWLVFGAAIVFIEALGLLGCVLTHLIPLIQVEHFWFLLLILPMSVGVMGGLFITASGRAIRKYMQETMHGLEREGSVYIPLARLDSDEPRSTSPNGTTQQVSPSLVDLQDSYDGHILLLGTPGSGKTTALRAYQYMQLGPLQNAGRGNGKIPLYISLREYNTYRKNVQQENGTHSLTSLIPYICASISEKKLRPHIPQLFDKGRILLLCDDLDAVETTFLSEFCQQMIDMMNGKNTVYMACDDTFYREQPRLQTMLADVDYMQEVVLVPLVTNQITDFITEYYNFDVASMHTAKSYTVAEVNSVIDTFHLQEDCTNPAFLHALIEVIAHPTWGMQGQVETRGLLLQHIVRQVERVENVDYKNELNINEDDVKTLLCIIAGEMYRRQTEIFLGSVVEGEEGLIYRRSYHELATYLNNFLLDVSDDESVLDADEDPSLLLPFFSVQQIASILAYAEATALITISPKNQLRFRYPVFKEYFAAQYLQMLYEIVKQERLPLEVELLMNAKDWLNVIQTWSGLISNPIQLEDRVAYAGRSIVDYGDKALMLGILCADARLRYAQEYVLPNSLEELFKQILTGTGSIEKLARVFTICAQESGERVYSFLLPFITFKNVDELLCTLDKGAVAALLFKYLPDAIEKNRYDVVFLIRSILGRLGRIVIPLATEACQARLGLTGPAFMQNLQLRKIAINVLGRVHDKEAVDVLLHYLREGGAISDEILRAFVDTGPRLALKPILEEVTGVTSYEGRKVAVEVIRGFLNGATDQTQYRDIINTLLFLLSAKYEYEIQQSAKTPLIQEAQSNESRAAFVIKSLISTLAISDIDHVQMLNIEAVLEQIAAKATSYLLQNLQQASETAALRIIQVIAKTRDKAAIPDLVARIAVASQSVRELAATTLVLYAPDSVVPLVELILSPEEHDEREARAAFLILKDIGNGATEYIVQNLLRVVPERTQFLVQVLGHTRNTYAVPSLLELLQFARSKEDNVLVQNVVEVLGRIPDKQSITPLLDTLLYAAVKPSLQWLYEEVCKTLSHFSQEGLPELIAALDSEQETPLTQGVRQAIFFMEPFPQQQLLDVFGSGRVTQAEQGVRIFRMQGVHVAPFLVGQLCHPNARVQYYVQKTLDEMPESELLQALLDAHHTECRHKIAPYLARYANASTPRLVNFLSSDDLQQREAAVLTLIEFGNDVIPELAISLNQQRNNAYQHSQYILETLVQKDASTLQKVLLLFRSLPEPSAQFGRRALLHVLTNHLAEVSTSALIEALNTPDIQIRQGAVEALILLIQKNNEHSVKVLKLVRDAFLIEERRAAAASVLGRCGASVVPYVQELATSNDVGVKQMACEVLSTIGTPALPTVLKFIASPTQKDMGRSILRGMKTPVILDYLIELLGRQDFDEVENAWKLLLERVRTDNDISIRPLDKEQEIVSALLEHVKTQPRKAVHLRIMAFLLLLDKNVVLRALNLALGRAPYSSSWLEWLTPLFLMLNMEGIEARNVLLRFVQSSSLPSKLSNEVVGILGMIETNEIVEKDAVSLVNGAKMPRRTGSMQSNDQRELARHALGGLLVGGNWNGNKLQELQRNAKEMTNEHELFTVLLGDSYVGHIEALNRQLSDEQFARRQEAQEFARRIQEVKKEVEGLNNELASKRSELVAMKRQLTDSRNTVNEERAKNSSLQNQIDRLKNHNGPAQYH